MKKFYAICFDKNGWNKMMTTTNCKTFESARQAAFRKIQKFLKKQNLNSADIEKCIGWRVDVKIR